MKLELRMKNPTSYVFNVPPDTIREVILRIKHRLPLLNIISADDSVASMWLDFLKGDANRYNFYLREARYPSVLYKGVEKPIKQYISLIIQVTSLDGKSYVQILPETNKIIVGTKFPSNWIKIMHSIPISEKVEPSTVEEYYILLEMGRELGIIDSMPPLILPEGVYEWPPREKRN